MKHNFRDMETSVNAECHHMRLDQAVAASFTISRRKARQLIEIGGVYLNRKRCRQAGRIVATGNRLRLVQLDGEQIPAFQPQQLLWRTHSLLLIHKLCGQYSQEALHRAKGCLPDELTRLYSSPARPFRPVHRLDRETSGLLLFCCDAQELQRIQQHWHQAAQKHYLAVVDHEPEWDKKTIDLPISAQRDKQGCYAISDQGRPCRTLATVLQRRHGRCLLQLQAVTGRSHQLRVHLSALGCPILGDVRYGGSRHHRMMLHAWQLHIGPPAMPESRQWKTDPEEDWKW